MDLLKLATMGVILTPNSRLEQHLKTKFAQQNNTSVAKCPQIFAVNNWLTRSYDFCEYQGHTDKLLLTKLQSLQKFKDIILNSSGSDKLLQIHQLSKTAYSAYSLLNQWLIDKLEFNYEKIDVEIFAGWAKIYRNWLCVNNYLDKSELFSCITKMPLHLWQQYINSSQVMLYGFDNITPQMQAVFDFISENLATVEHMQGVDIVSTKLAFSYKDTTAEFIAAANWAKDMVANNKKVAIVVPDLAKFRDEIEEILATTFSAASTQSPVRSVDKNFNISTGNPLYLQPIINDIFNLFVKHDYNSCYLPNNDKISLSNNKILHSEFVASFKKILEKHNWPGTRRLTSIEHQTVKKFYTALLDYSSLELTSSKLTFNQHLQTLAEMLADIPFQAENKHAKVQVLGVLEAAGLEFDGIWVSNCYDKMWPQKHEPNPFLPFKMQQQLDMPHASSAKELKFATNITKRLSRSCHEFIQSLPEVADNFATIPSSLILAPIERKIIREKVQEPLEFIEKYSDWRTDSIAPNSVQHGSSILQEIALCPFRGYAKGRLKLDYQEPENIGITYLAKGTIIHAVLEKLSVKLNSRAAIMAVLESLDTIIMDAITKVVARHKNLLQHAPLWHQEVEVDRIKNILLKFYHLELEREDFKILACEQKYYTTINNIPINLRIDRIDLTTHGKVIIDYKTGDYKVPDIIDDPLRKVQLPLYYFAANDNTISAVTVAKITSEDTKYIGVANEENIISSLTAVDFVPLVEFWQRSLNNYAQKFLEGYAELEPLEGAATCRNCHLQNLCRMRFMEA